MESRLQSNEVRIPKTSGSAPVSSAAAAVVTSSAFMRSRSENGAVPQYHHHQTHHNPPDFDLNAPCQYFKSSFARSLSLNSSNQTKSLDFGINFGLSRSSPIREEPQTPVAFGQDKCAAAYLVEMPPPPLPLTQPPTIMSTGSGHSAAAPGPSNGSSSRNVWSTSPKQSFNRRSLDSSEIEVLRLRKECQNLVEENRRLMGLASGVVGGNLVVPGNSSNIEAVILQTQVDTLQWQLKQVEASRQMYRAVMEEVVRFLERCHRNLDSMQNEQISRSKSIHHVYRNDSTNSTSNNNNNNNNNNDGSNPASPRARSSTNLMDVQKSCQSKSNEEPSTTTSPVASYNNFRDFTWRRSPKRAASQLATTECDPEKLSQDAFRLLRTAQNLLNTQEPDLTQPKHTIELQYSTNYINPSVPVQSKSNAPSTSSKPKSCQLDCESFCLTFSRKMNMRESRLSLRSSTDSSVHSTSSSKNETDEENHSPPITKETTACSTTEDESGFSSISSFQEIGLPLHSTMISPIPTNNSSISDDSGESNTDICLDSRNSTLKASQTSMGSSVGLPLPPNHRRWDSAPAVPPRTNLHRFSTLPPDDSPTVLWV